MNWDALTVVITTCAVGMALGALVVTLKMRAEGKRKYPPVAIPASAIDQDRADVLAALHQDWLDAMREQNSEWRARTGALTYEEMEQLEAIEKGERDR